MEIGGSSERDDQVYGGDGGSQVDWSYTQRYVHLLGGTRAQQQQVPCQVYLFL